VELTRVTNPNVPQSQRLTSFTSLDSAFQALTKFLKSVVWNDPAEAKQAVDLLPAWVDIDTDDALELLGSSFENREVRSYAVAQLRSANDDVRACNSKITLPSPI